MKSLCQCLRSAFTTQSDRSSAVKTEFCSLSRAETHQASLQPWRHTSYPVICPLSWTYTLLVLIKRQFSLLPPPLDSTPSTHFLNPIPKSSQCYMCWNFNSGEIQEINYWASTSHLYKNYERGEEAIWEVLWVCWEKNHICNTRRGVEMGFVQGKVKVM